MGCLLTGASAHVFADAISFFLCNLAVRRLEGTEFVVGAILKIQLLQRRIRTEVQRLPRTILDSKNIRPCLLLRASHRKTRTSLCQAFD